MAGIIFLSVLIRLSSPVCSKVKELEERSREMGEQMASMKKEMEDSRMRSDKGKTTCLLLPVRV